MTDSDAEITTTECRGCGAMVSGLNGRFACGVCGWVNHWSQGRGGLPVPRERDAAQERRATKPRAS